MLDSVHTARVWIEFQRLETHKKALISDEEGKIKFARCLYGLMVRVQL